MDVLVVVSVELAAVGLVVLVVFDCELDLLNQLSYFYIALLRAIHAFEDAV